MIDEKSLEVKSGSDLIRSVFLADKNGAYSLGANVAFNRFCSADLPAVSALYDAASGKGTGERIFMNESGAEGRTFAHVVTGAQGGSSYELPYLGRMAFENAVANPVQRSDHRRRAGRHRADVRHGRQRTGVRVRR